MFGFIAFHLKYLYLGQSHDFRTVGTKFRMIGGLEETEMYIVERAKAIERARAKAGKATHLA